MEGKAALALIVALLQELKDAQTLGPEGLEAVLSNAQFVSGPEVKAVIDQVRVELRR